ncbi:hypothetical protein SAMN02745174_02055 [Cetobacterium ceti]|uniref:Uncharacterized protein n=1 Tax=Cetobacterium ceti TaxID=180163 RepID=A0A1T4PUY1_9FUSO|nr:DUF6148 family protein [Cetobacterium ceti]SJZ95355.1 hypothetical protein SAMN02745174_02055 [Cetobacterium ceti]
MTGITLKEAQSRYREYLDAESKALKGQRYKIENQELERASLSEIREGIKYWENKCIEIARGGKKITTMRIIPRDL